MEPAISHVPVVGCGLLVFLLVDAEQEGLLGTQYSVRQDQLRQRQWIAVPAPPGGGLIRTQP
jgi:hypothetical protein